MTTRTKLNISSSAASIMMLLNVFSKPLHIPETIQWVLLIGFSIPLGLMFYFIKKQKKEKLAPATSGNARSQPPADSAKKKKNILLLMMAVGVVIGLAAPLWMPLTGTTGGTVVDLICGLIAAAVVCIIIGLKVRKL
jgi:hypothetical protein